MCPGQVRGRPPKPAEMADEPEPEAVTVQSLRHRCEKSLKYSVSPLIGNIGDGQVSKMELTAALVTPFLKAGGSSHCAAPLRYR